MSFLNRLSCNFILLAIWSCAPAIQPWVPPVVVTEDTLYRVETSVTEAADHYSLTGRVPHAHSRSFGRKYAHVELVIDGTVQQEWNLPLRKTPVGSSRLTHRGGVYEPRFVVKVLKPLPENASFTVSIRSGRPEGD